MPLIDSGAALFAGRADEFAKMAPASNLTTHLAAAFSSRWGKVSESEIRSWRNSLTALAQVVVRAGLQETGTGVELKLPHNDRRVDAFFTGRTQGGDPGVVLVELKQWESAAPSKYPDNVVVGDSERLHPSVQAASYAEYLRGSHSAFTEDEFDLWACAYLHNMPKENAPSLRGVRYEGAFSTAPFYVSGEEEQLANALSTRIGHGSGMDILPKVLRGRYSPSPKLLESISRALKESPVWTLLDEQRLAFNIVRGLTEQTAKTGKKATLIVTGGPGTGKSVIALHLLISLSQTDRRRVAHATGSKAFTTNLRALAPGGTAVFRYFNNFRQVETEESDLDVIICDEAHRIRTSSNDRFTSKARQSSVAQVDELIRAARVSVFLLDQRQNVRPGEIGSVSVIEEAARRMKVPIERVALDSQFRCNGCPQYVQWVDKLFSPTPEPVGAWLAAGDYDLRVYEKPNEMESALKASLTGGNTGRLVAGFCWPWSDPDAEGDLIEDVVIDDWQRPWNEKAPEQQKKPKAAPPPSRHPYYLWATMPDRVREVGCVYSAQGFEFDYCAVILGNDLVWREGFGWVASRDASEDPSIKRRKLEQAELRNLLNQTYRVLMTRGMKGTFVYSTDWETMRKIRSLTHS